MKKFLVTSILSVVAFGFFPLVHVSAQGWEAAVKAIATEIASEYLDSLWNEVKITDTGEGTILYWVLKEPKCSTNGDGVYRSRDIIRAIRNFMDAVESNASADQLYQTAARLRKVALGTSSMYTKCWNAISSESPRATQLLADAQRIIAAQ